jgi:hypothetical protein
MIGRRVDDAIFIAHAREDVPALLDALTDAEADRDRWKERAEALERALEMQTEGLCEYCTGYGRECPECSYSEREGWNFCFDEARFKECETCQDP